VRVSVDESREHEPSSHGLTAHVGHAHGLLGIERREVAAVDPLHDHGATRRQLGEGHRHVDIPEERQGSLEGGCVLRLRGEVGAEGEER